MRRGIVVLIVLAAAAGCEKERGQSESGQSNLPVRWTSHVALSSLNDIEAGLDTPVATPDGKGLVMLVVEDGDTVKDVEVHTVREYLTALAKGDPRDNFQVKVESWFKQASVPAMFLKDAAAAKVSYVTGFDVTRRPLAVPATLGPCFSPSEEVRVRRMMAEGKGWREIWPEMKWTVRDPHEVVLEDDWGWVYVTMLAWGDFNHDGIEDVLVNVSTIGKLATWRSYEYVVLTRRAPGGAMEVVAVDQPAAPEGPGK